MALENRKKPYSKGKVAALGLLVAVTSAGPSGMAETNCFFSPSFTGGMMATAMKKQIRC